MIAKVHRLTIMLGMIAFLLLTRTNLAQEGSKTSGAVAQVPRLITMNGALKDRSGKPYTGVVGLSFALYKDQEGGAPLWLETQNGQLDEAGRYTVLLGAYTGGGLPLDLFTSGETRWLGVQPLVPGEEERPRVLLVSVPYALKAADAETLGGKPASAYVLAPADGNDTETSAGGSSNKAPSGLDVFVGQALNQDGTNTAFGFNAVPPTDSTVAVYSPGTSVSRLKIKSDQHPNWLTTGGNLGSLLFGVDGGGASTPTVGSVQSIVRNGRYDLGFSSYGSNGLTENMTVTGTGRVGIGKTDPAAALDVNGTVKANYLFGDSAEVYQPGQSVSTLKINSDQHPDFFTTGGSLGSLLFGVDGSGPNTPTVGGLKSMARGGHYDLGFFSYSFGLNERMTISGLGGVGIGNINPTTALDVNGTVKALSFTGDGAGLTNLQSTYFYKAGQSASNVKINSDQHPNWQTTGGSLGSLLFGVDGNGPNTPTVGALKSMARNGSYDLGFFAYSNGLSEVLTIAGNGNVGVGTIAPSAKLDVNGSVNASSFVGSGAGLSGISNSNLSTAARTRMITYLGGCDTCSVLADTDDQKTLYFNAVGTSLSIVSVTCFSDVGTPSINLKRDDGSPASILTSDLACSASGTTSTNISGSEGTIQANEKIDFELVAAGGTAKRVTISIKAVQN